VVVTFSPITNRFFGGEGYFPNIVEAHNAIEARRQVYRQNGYSGPMPWRITAAADGRFIEEGT
jgi:hypothetical protein